VPTAVPLELSRRWVPELVALAYLVLAAVLLLRDGLRTAYHHSPTRPRRRHKGATASAGRQP
jgi:hypothetical protein